MGVRERLAESKARLKSKEQEETNAGPEKSSEQACADLAADILGNMLPAVRSKVVGGYISESPPGSVKPQGTRKPPPPVVRTEQVKATCGHLVPFGLFEDKLDKHREIRRSKITDRACPECRRVAQAAKEKAEQEARMSKQSKKVKRPFQQKLERLPDNANFDAYYHANEQTWKGRLTIPNPGPGWSQVGFYDEASAVFKLLSKLDLKWRAWLRDHPIPESTESTTLLEKT